MVDSTVAVLGLQINEQRMQKGLARQLYDAVYEDDIGLVRALVRQGADPTGDGENMETSPLRCAIWYGRVRILDLLYTLGGNMNSTVFLHGQSLLLSDYAAWCNSGRTLRCILEHGGRYTEHAKRFHGMQTIIACYEGRVDRARFAVSALLSRATKRHWGRDIARLLARLVWGSRRRDCWE